MSYIREPKAVLMKNRNLTIESKAIADFKKDLYLYKKMELESEQEKMLAETSNNVYVVAGAGSGKTTTLVWRIVTLEGRLFST